MTESDVPDTLGRTGPTTELANFLVALADASTPADVATEALSGPLACVGATGVWIGRLASEEAATTENSVHGGENLVEVCSAGNVPPENRRSAATQRSIASGETVVDIDSDGIDSANDSADRGAQCVLALPVLSAGAVIGVMVVASGDDRQLSPDVLFVLSGAAAGIGLWMADRKPVVAASPPVASVVLSPRQRSVLHLMALGVSRSAMAARLRCSEATVLAEVQAVIRALGARGRSEALVIAQGRGILPGELALPPSLGEAV